MSSSVSPPILRELRLDPYAVVEGRLPILVGEIAYNLRSALDYLVFELAKLDSGIEQSDTQFPLEDTLEGFKRSLKRGRLSGINDAHIAAIERLQPYNRCDWSGRLRDLSNPDKHRHLVKAGGRVDFTAHSSLEKDLSRITGYERYADHPIPGQPPVKVKVHVAAYHKFADGSPVIESIEEIQTQISDALKISSRSSSGERAVRRVSTVQRRMAASPQLSRGKLQ